MLAPSDSPKTRMNRNELRIGAAIVIVQIFRTRTISRVLSATRPRLRAGAEAAHRPIAFT